MRRFFLGRIKKLVLYLGLYRSSLHFLRKTLFIVSKINFPYVDVSFDMPNTKLISKQQQLRMLDIFPLKFVADTKLTRSFKKHWFSHYFPNILFYIFVDILLLETKFSFKFSLGHLLERNASFLQIYSIVAIRFFKLWNP